MEKELLDQMLETLQQALAVRRKRQKIVEQLREVDEELHQLALKLKSIEEQRVKNY